MSKRISYKDLTTALAFEGIEQCRRMLKGDGVANPYGIALKACVDLRDRAAPSAAIQQMEALANEFKPAETGGQRGRVALAPGMERRYTVQQVKAVDGGLSDVFIRLPVGTLNVAKKDEVEVTVQDDGSLLVRRV